MSARAGYSPCPNTGKLCPDWCGLTEPCKYAFADAPRVERHEPFPVCKEGLCTRAFAIADEAMLCMIQSECSLSLEDPDYVGLVGDDGCEVTQLCDASTAIREAFDWLSQRGLAELRTDEHGEFIVLKERA